MRDPLARGISSGSKAGLTDETAEEAILPAARSVLMPACGNAESCIGALFDHAALGMAMVSPKGYISRANPAFCSFLGYSEAELQQLSPADITHPDDLKSTGRHFARAEKGERPAFNGEKRYLRRDGSVVWGHTSVAWLEDRCGQLAGSLALVQDITERKKAEQALLESEARYRLLFETNPHPMWVYDLETLAFLAVNDAAVRNYGWSREEFLRMTIRDIRPPEEVHRLVEGGRKMRTGLHRAGVWRHRCKDSSLIDVEITCHPIHFNGRQGELALAHDVTERLRAEREISRLAYLDTLTGLPNRALLLDRLEQLLLQADRRRRHLAVLFLDLDQFKRINDTMGHSAGDELLLSVAQRLRGCLRRSDTVARLGGDEFAILLSEVRDEREVAQIATQVIESLAPPHRLAEREAYATASIGIALSPMDGRDPETLLKNGDMAMYAAKERGRNTFQFFSEAMNDKAVRRLELENSLRRALEEKQFFLVYQPQVDLTSGGVTGVEALLRWRHPQRGVMSPDEFIPVAEETGLILAIGRWVLETACAAASRWHASGFRVRMAVNISGRQFRQGDFAAMVMQAVGASGLNPQWLELELTESILMEPTPERLQSLRSLAERGIRLAIDDFGTGYSSLSYLHDFPLHRIKIAQVFIRGLRCETGNAGIVEAIVGMARSLNLGVIAEGVESRGELEFLSTRGCREMQGFYFARPLAEADLLRAFTDGLGQSGVCPFRVG